MDSNRIIRNVFYKCGAVYSGPATVSDNLVTDEDPGFVAADEQNFQLKDDSPAYALGFQPILVEEIGLTD